MIEVKVPLTFPQTETSKLHYPNISFHILGKQSAMLSLIKTDFLAWQTGTKREQKRNDRFSA
jgi:hypothetical protein